MKEIQYNYQFCFRGIKQAFFFFTTNDIALFAIFPNQKVDNIFLLINQVRESATPNGMISYKEPGGKALEYYASVCIRFGSRTFTLGDNMDACKKDEEEKAGYQHGQPRFL